MAKKSVVTLTRTPTLERVRLCKILEQKRLRRSEAYLYDTASFDEAVYAQEIAQDIAVINFGIRVSVTTLSEITLFRQN